MASNGNAIEMKETLPDGGVQKRFDTSGRATAELISELQKRSIGNGLSSNKNKE